MASTSFRHSRRVRMLVALALWSLPLSATGQDSSGTEALLRRLPTVARFCGQEFSLDALARSVAPVVWLAPREQEVPDRLPRTTYTEPAREPSMYYRIRRISFSTRAVPNALTPLTTDIASGNVTVTPGQINGALTWQWPVSELAALNEVDIRFFFYYWDETGGGRHPDDVESAEFKVVAGRPDTDGCVFIYLWQMFGSAHGLSLSTNAADLSRVTGLVDRRGRNDKNKIPAWLQPYRPFFYQPVVFVEAGKHATAPDVDQNEHLTPVIDLNASFMDAWGIRDVLGTDSRQPPSYQPQGFVPRELLDLWWPRVMAVGADQPSARNFLEVVPSRTEKLCENQTQFEWITETWKQARKPERRFLFPPSPNGLLSDKGFCGPTEMDLNKSPATLPRLRGNLFFLQDTRNPYKKRWEVLDLAFRLDRGFGWTAVVPVAISPPWLGGWFAAKISGRFPQPARDALSTVLSLGKNRTPPDPPKAIEVMYMPSATRTIGWYGLGGFESDDHDDSYKLTEPRLVWEAGFKVRVPPIAGFYPSFRIGYRFNGTSTITNQRWVMDAGVGVW